LAWVRDTPGLHLEVATGVMPVSQSEASLQKAQALSMVMSAFALTAFHDLVSLSGSFVLGLMAAQNCDTPENLWNISRIDENWQQELWGVDDEAAEMAALKKAQFEHAYAFYQASVLS